MKTTHGHSMIFIGKQTQPSRRHGRLRFVFFGCVGTMNGKARKAEAEEEADGPLERGVERSRRPFSAVGDRSDRTGPIHEGARMPSSAWSSADQGAETRG